MGLVSFLGTNRHHHHTTNQQQLWLSMAARFRLSVNRFGRSILTIPNVLSKETASLSAKNVWNPNSALCSLKGILAGKVE